MNHGILGVICTSSLGCLLTFLLVCPGVLKIFPVINTGFEHTDESGNTGLNYAVNIVKM